MKDGSPQRHRKSAVSLSGKKQCTSSLRQRILLVDDHAVVREGFAELINRQQDLEVCCQANTAAKALGLAVTRNLDLVVVDLSLEEGSGLDLIKDLKVVGRSYRRWCFRCMTNVFMPNARCAPERWAT